MKVRRGKGWIGIQDKNVLYLLEDGPSVWIDPPESWSWTWKRLKWKWKDAIRNPWFWFACLVVVVGWMFLAVDLMEEYVHPNDTRVRVEALLEP